MTTTAAETAARADTHGGIWGASRHALTVGFLSTMVFAIGRGYCRHSSACAFYIAKD
jgi:hypothetical protein